MDKEESSEPVRLLTCYRNGGALCCLFAEKSNPRERGAIVSSREDASFWGFSIPGIEANVVSCGSCSYGDSRRCALPKINLEVFFFSEVNLDANVHRVWLDCGAPDLRRSGKTAQHSKSTDSALAPRTECRAS